MFLVHLFFGRGLVVGSDAIHVKMATITAMNNSLAVSVAILVPIFLFVIAVY